MLRSLIRSKKRRITVIKVPANTIGVRERISLRNELKQEVVISAMENKLPTTFTATVVSSLGETNNPSLGTAYGNAPTNNPNEQSYFFARMRRVDIDEMEKPDPFLAKTRQRARKLANMHPLGVLLSSGDGKAPQIGEEWTCRYLTKDRKGIVLIQKTGVSQNFLALATKESPFQMQSTNFSDGIVGDYAPSGGTGGSRSLGFGGQHIIEKLESRVNPSTSVVVGVGSRLSAQQALAEIQFWKGKVEQHVSTGGNSPENMRIKLYKMYVDAGITDPADPKVAKASIGGSAKGGTGGASTGVMHWSATSISYVMRGTGFPKYYGHSYYSDAVARGKAPGWEIHSIKREKIKAQVGDVFVRTGGHGRGKTKYTASHGDVVYKITAAGAHVAGGNLGAPGTFKESRILPLDSNGVVTNSKGYLIVLKKMR